MKQIQTVLFLVATLGFFFCGKRRNIDDTNCGSTYGTTSGTDGYRSTKISYIVDGKEYVTDMINPPFNVVDGEKYPVKYDISNPSRSEVEFWNPIFLDSETTINLTGTISRGPYWYRPGLYAIEFSYNAAGQKVTRGQKLPRQFDKKYSNLKKGDAFAVRAWSDNLVRSVLYLDSPAIHR